MIISKNMHNYFSILTVFLTLFFAFSVSSTPTILDFNINNDANYTTSDNITLYLYADFNTNATKKEMAFNCDNDTWNWIPYAETYSTDIDALSGCTNADGIKIIYTKVREEVIDWSISDVNSDSISLDQTPPITTSDLNSNKWYSNEQTIILTCTDEVSDCDVTKYRVDSDSSNAVDFSSSTWKTYNSSINTELTSITGDGNWAIDFNSTDKAGNVEATKTIYFLRDFSEKPTITILQPTNGSIVSSNKIIFDVNDSLSGIDLSSIRMDVNGIDVSMDLNSCIKFEKNYHCEYSPSSIDTDNTDYNVTVYAKDYAGNVADQATVVFKFQDNIAPVKPQQPWDVVILDNTLAVRWVKNTESDLDYYKVYRYLSSTANCDDATVTDANVVGKVFQSHSSCQSGTCKYYDTNAVIQDNYYCYKISAVDKSGNVSDISERTLHTIAAPASTPPTSTTISSSTHSNDTWDTDVDVALTWSDVINAAGYNCLWTTDKEASLSTTPGDGNAQCSARYWDENGLANGIYYFKVNACNGAGCSDTTTFIVKIDNSAPSVPTGLSAKAVSTTQINVSWNASSDSPSGTTITYELYRNNSKIADTTSTSYNDSGLSSETTYTYKVRAKDNAGNVSDYSSTVSETTNSENTSTANEETGTSGSTPDTINPTVSWSYPINGAELVPGIIELKADASDNKGVKKVIFYVDKNYLGEGTLADGKYTFSWDASSIALGEHTLKVIVRDKANNSANAKITVKFVKASKLESQNIISQAEEKSANFSSKIDLLKAYGLELSSEMQALLDEANTKLAEAKTNKDSAEYDKAKENANKAIELFDKVAAGFSAEESSKEIAFEESKLADLISFSGLDNSLQEDANALMQTIKVSKVFKTLKFSVGEKVSYYGKIVLTVTNSGVSDENHNADKNIQLIEFVPKDFAEKASFIKSETEFEILKEDPVIVFNLSLNAGETKEISYYSTKAINETLVTAENWQESFLPSMALEKISGVDIMPAKAKEQDFSSSGLFGIDLGNTVILLIGGILLAIITIVALFTLHAKGLEFGGFRGRKEEPSKRKWAYKG